MSKNHKFNSFIRHLERRVSDLEVVNDKKLTLAKLHGSFSKAGNDLNICLDRNYLKGKDFTNLRNNINTATMCVTQKINPNFQTYDPMTLSTESKENSIPSQPNEKVDDIVQVEGKTKFFGAIPSKPSRIV